MKADPAAQRRLLDVQDCDTRLDQIAYAVRSLPQHRTLEELGARLAATDVELVTAETALSDTGREQDRAEADVELVRQRAARNRARLDEGTGPAKELQALQSELASLGRRQSELEEIEIEVMERVEALQTQVREVTERRDVLTAERAQVQRERDLALEGFAGEAAEVEQRRAGIVPQVPADLLALYDKVRAQHGGVGAALLQRRRCGGCELELNQLELDRIRATTPDDVVRCQECARILVRSDESGI